MKLLALEASQKATYHLSRYEQVAALGVELHVLNGRGEPEFWPRDRYRIVGSKHIDDIVDAAREWHRRERFDGVLTFAESAVVTVATVAEQLGLPGIGVEAATRSRNKILMREAHQQGGAPHPRFRFVTAVGEALQAAAEFGYPVIVKPTLGAASSFVFRVDDPATLERRFAQAWAGIDRMPSFTAEADGLDLGPHGLIVESFLEGREFLIEALAWDDDVYLGSIVDRVTVEGDTFDDDVHAAPTSLTAEQVADVHQAVQAGVHAQGIRRSAMHAEVRFHRDEPFLLEIAVRPGGGGLDHMARVSAGYCPIEAVVDVAAGIRPAVTHYRPTPVHTAAMALLSNAGTIAEVVVPEELTMSDRVLFCKIVARPGDVIRRPPDGNNVIGFLGVTGTSFDEAMTTATDLASRIEVRFTA